MAKTTTRTNPPDSPRWPALAMLRRRLAAWPVIAGFGAIYFLSQALIGVVVQPLGSDMLRVQTSLSAETVRAIFARWEAAGLLDAYLAHYRYDMVHPLWYGVFLAALLARGFEANQVDPRRNLLLLLPFVAAACDLLENVLHLGFAANRDLITPATVLVANGAALTKWAIAAGCLVAAAGLAVGGIRRQRASATRLRMRT